MVRYGFAALVSIGIVVRIFVVAFPGDELKTPWSGGGDTPAYLLLASNLVTGRGFSYAGQPSAFRPPAYPVLLAGVMRLFGSHYVAVVRWFQFAVGLVTVYLCARVAARLFGREAAKATVLFALFSPTLIVMTSEVLTECIATLLTSVFLCLLTRYITQPDWPAATGMGLTTGVASLFRFNMAPLLLVGLWAVLHAKEARARWQQAAGMALVAVLVVSPWIVRNQVVFAGRVVFSTQGGLNAVVAMVEPQGRSQPGETEKLRQMLGWVPPTELETNASSRTRLQGEAELDRQGWSVARRLWRQCGWHWIPLTLTKWASFWFSTDQLFNTASFPLRQRVYRAGGLLAYWFILFLATWGWLWLRNRHAEIAHMFFLYAILFTVLHLPFVMNTRLRMPLMDPMLVMLAGGGWLSMKPRPRQGIPKESLATVGRSGWS